MPDNRTSLDLLQHSLLPALGKALLIAAASAVAVFLLACWLLYCLVSAPYRSSRPAAYDRGARLEATIALVMAVTALIRTLRRREALC